MAGDITLGYVERLNLANYMAGQKKYDVEITGGTISNVTLSSIDGLTLDVPLNGASGGTGIANTGKTITLGGNLVTSGLFDLTLTLTGTTALTVPTSGTLTTTSNKLSVFAATTSTELRGVISDETGTGALVFATSPTLATPVLGAATATSINKVAITAPATSSTLTIADGSSLITSGANSLTLTTAGATNVTLPTTGTLVNTAVTALTSLASVGTITSGTWSATAVAVANGGTGATTAVNARTNLGVVIGTDVQAFDSDLAALAGNATNGMWARTGTGTGSARTITGTANQVTVTNGDGVSGNPTVALAGATLTAFTPTYIGSSTAGTTTYTQQTGTYCQIGNVVFFNIYLGWSAATGTGNIRVGGLPFTSANGAAAGYPCSVWANNIAFGAGNALSAVVTNAQSFIDFYQIVPSGANITVPIDAAGQLILFGSYFV